MVISPNDSLAPATRSLLTLGRQAMTEDSTGDALTLADAIQHLAFRLAAVEKVALETHDRCAICGGWIKKQTKAVRVTIHTDAPTPEDARILAYHPTCVMERDPDDIVDEILKDCHQVGGPAWTAPGIDGGQRVAVLWALIRGLPHSQERGWFMDEIREAGLPLPREWTR